LTFQFVSSAVKVCKEMVLKYLFQFLGKRSAQMGMGL